MCFIGVSWVEDMWGQNGQMKSSWILSISSVSSVIYLISYIIYILWIFHTQVPKEYWVSLSTFNIGVLCLLILCLSHEFYLWETFCLLATNLQLKPLKGLPVFCKYDFIYDTLDILKTNAHFKALLWNKDILKLLPFSIIIGLIGLPLWLN